MMQKARERHARGRLNLHRLVPETGLEPAPEINRTSPSSWRVCQFRHSGLGGVFTRVKTHHPGPSGPCPVKNLLTTQRQSCIIELIQGDSAQAMFS